MSEVKRYYWLKLKEDFFTSKEIKQLRKLAGGDTFTIIYLKMLLRSLDEDGKLYFEGIEDNFPAEVALDIDEDVENVKVTIAFLMAKGILVQCNEAEWEVITAKEMTGSEGESARRMRRMRQAKSLISDNKRLIASHCDAAVTRSDADVMRSDTEKEKDIRDREKNNMSIFSPDGFAKFWSAYPKHEAKKDAIKAWNALKPNNDLCNTIFADLEKRLASGGVWYKADRKYIPLPATYLRGARWEDESGGGDADEKSDEPWWKSKPWWEWPKEEQERFERERNGSGLG